MAVGNSPEKADGSDSQGPTVESVENGKGQDASIPNFDEEESAIEKR